MSVEDCFLFGTIIKPHGYKGHLTIKVDSSIKQKVSKMERMYLENKGTFVPFFVSEFSQNGQTAILKFEDIETDKEANKLAQSRVFVENKFLPKKQTPDFQPNLFADFEAFDENNILFGKIDAIFEVPANMLFSVLHVSGKEILIPAQLEFISSVDKKTKKVFFNLPEGYLDVYLSESHQKDDGD
ncbi:MAG: 16S rRNA processing protein RimM [Bacteroidetes bacterium]|nr:MAG: 16S rRNA processing protein RimM [Bacteroidota bacterium]